MLPETHLRPHLPRHLVTCRVGRSLVQAGFCWEGTFRAKKTQTRGRKKTTCKWGYSPYKWLTNNKVTGCITPMNLGGCYYDNHHLFSRFFWGPKNATNNPNLGFGASTMAMATPVQSVHWVIKPWLPGWCDLTDGFGCFFLDASSMALYLGYTMLNCFF